MSTAIPEMEARGLLFCGDVHLSSQRPDKRKDHDYSDTVLKKVARVVEIANENELILVFLGDIFHHHKETNEAVKTHLLRILNELERPALTNVGNHDKRGDRLGDGDTLSVVTEPNAPLRAFRQTGGLYLNLSGHLVGLGFTPHGQEIPADVRDVFPEAEAVAWVTHHDIQFDRPYPGSRPPHEILGCNLVVNGHMHLHKGVVDAGDTQWFNPGSLTRTSIDAIEHKPTVWSLVPGESLQPFVVPHNPDVFDLTGRMIDPVSPEDRMWPADTESRFVQLLASMNSGVDPLSAPDGRVLWEGILQRFDEEKTAPEVRAVIQSLFAEATERAKAKEHA